MNILRISDVLVTLLLCQKIFAFSYTSKDGVKLNYTFWFKRSCRGEHDRIGVLPGISLPECVKECGMRPFCKALNYKRMFNTCHMYYSEENKEDRSKGSCVEVKASDIEIKEKPFEVCDQDKSHAPGEKTCKHTECLHNVVPKHGKILGNMRSVGDRIQYKCDFRYKVAAESEYAECLPSGNWSVTFDKCTEIIATNIALGKPTKMSSVWSHNGLHFFGGEKGVDGDINQMWEGGSCFCTDPETNPWWQVDLQAIYAILRVTLFNRMDTLSDRATSLSLAFGPSEQNLEQVEFVSRQIDDIHTFHFPTRKEARYVKVQLMVEGVLNLCEVQVFGIPVQ